METRIKITYLDMYSTNKVLAKVVNIYGWINLSSKLNELGIYDSQVIRVERVLVASSENTEEL